MNEKIEKLLDDFARANIRLMQGSFDMDAVDNARAAILAEIDRLTAEKEKAGAQYMELIYAVATKFPHETRHQTALRYIRERERKYVQAASENKYDKHEG